MEAQVPRLWKPPVCCASCRYPNDFDFKFCQKCCFVRQPLEPFAPPPLVDVDGDRVSERLSALKASRDAKPYQRQKSSLQKTKKSLTSGLCLTKSLNSASPNDVISFLVWRDKFGKTVSHLNGCSGKVSTPAAGTIDNNTGKLRTIFKEAGRGSSWNDDLQLGNPASQSSVTNYHTMVLEEQVISGTFPKQAVPMFSDKLNIICSYLRKQVVLPNIKPISRFILARDLAFFSLDFFSGDRGSDLGRVKSSDVLSLNNL